MANGCIRTATCDLSIVVVAVSLLGGKIFAVHVQCVFDHTQHYTYSICVKVQFMKSI